MKRRWCSSYLRAPAIFSMGIVLVGACSLWSQSGARRVAVTVDDLPGTTALTMTGGQVVEMNSKLTAALRAEKIPVIGFVNEARLYRTGEVDDRIRALSMWPEAGFDLGNHTFSHASLNHTPLAEWELNVLRGETVTRMLLDQHHLKFQYFRYPYLDMGADLDTRRKAETFLTDHGYRIAPVTLDGWDWYFARVYEDARRRQDTALERRVVEAWLAHSDEIFAYDERKSRALFGYEPAQVLLIHDNWLEADHLSELLALLRKRGYQFVSLDEALNDQAYSSPDTYISGNGASSIDHWAITQGKPEPAEAEPAIPKWVRDRVDALAAKALP
jgi:peptidoglycan/xylan/chitin deacetylase (PgdA/CDA1 family)